MIEEVGVGADFDMGADVSVDSGVDDTTYGTGAAMSIGNAVERA